MVCFGSFASLSHLRQDFGLAVSTDLRKSMFESFFVFEVLALILQIARTTRICIEGIFSDSRSHNVLIF